MQCSLQYQVIDASASVESNMKHEMIKKEVSKLTSANMVQSVEWIRSRQLVSVTNPFFCTGLNQESNLALSKGNYEFI